MIYKNAFFFIFFFILTEASGQAVSYKIEKEIIGNKYYLKLSVIKDGSCYFTYSAGESLKPFTFLDDSIKTALVESLLSYEGDSSVCGNKILNFWPQYYRGNIPVSAEYEIQVQALHAINFIAFSYYAYSYSPFPVLYDMKEKTEITRRGTGLSEVFRLYKEWFSKIKKNGWLNYSFPLINSTYIWFGSLNKQMIFYQHPEWKDDSPGDLKKSRF